MIEEQTAPSQRAWARLAGLMYWVVLIVDLTGMQLHSPILGRSLMLAGSLFTVPLALGLYYAVKPAQKSLALAALIFRFLEAALGTLSTVAGFAGLRERLAYSGAGTLLLRIANWDNATNFAAFAFTIGSTIFFYLVVGIILIRARAGRLCHPPGLPAFPAMTMYAWTPMLLAETSTGLWLLFKSVNVTKQAVGQESSVQGAAVSS